VSSCGPAPGSPRSAAATRDSHADARAEGASLARPGVGPTDASTSEVASVVSAIVSDRSTVGAWVFPDSSLPDHLDEESLPTAQPEPSPLPPALLPSRRTALASSVLSTRAIDQSRPATDAAGQPSRLPRALTPFPSTPPRASRKGALGTKVGGCDVVLVSWKAAPRRRRLPLRLGTAVLKLLTCIASVWQEPKQSGRLPGGGDAPHHVRRLQRVHG